MQHNVPMYFAAFAALAPGLVANAQHPASHDSALGSAHFMISCNDEAQAVFDRGVILLHHMTYPLARSTFERVAELDTECAMAYWGMAMTLFQPLWPTRPGPSEIQEGRDLIGMALAARPPTEREQLFIAAADSFFHDADPTDYWLRIKRWHHGTEATYRQYPADDEAAAFYALSLLATAPPGGGSLDHQELAADLLLEIHADNPRHPGALHYLIHANDVQGRQSKSLDLVGAYVDIAPRNPHALHMPTHIYTRLGDWRSVVEGNLAAAEAALQHPAGDAGQYVWDEFPHAIEYLVYAYLQLGRDDRATEVMARLNTTPNLHPTFKTAFHVSSIPARYALERRDWALAASLRARQSETLDWDRYPWPESITWFARGLGAAMLGDLDEAKDAYARIEKLEETARTTGETLFLRQIQILRLGLGAWIQQEQGDPRGAISLMKEAAQLETSTPKHPVTPAPTIPAYELLGDMWLRQEQPDSAAKAFEISLAVNPGRFNSLLGAARAAQRAGRLDDAGQFYGRLLQSADSASHRDGLAEARRFMDRN